MKLTRNDVLPAINRPAMYTGEPEERSSQEYLADAVASYLNNRSYLLSPTRKKSDVILCDTCKGEGVVTKSELTCYHKGEYRYWDEPCERCDASGRMLFTVETYETLESYKTPEIK